MQGHFFCGKMGYVFVRNVRYILDKSSFRGIGLIMNRAERRKQERLSAKAGVSQKTQSVKPKLDEALAHHRDGRFSQAEQLYRQILDVHSTHADALHLLGLVVYQRADYQQARSLIEKAIQQNKANPQYHYNLGLTCERGGMLGEAENAYLQALHLKPHYVEARSNLGNVYRAQGDLKGAVVAYKQAIDQNPDYASCHNNLGVVLKEMRDLDGAIQAYQEALRLQPQNAEAHFNLGVVLAEREQCEEAAVQFQEAISINPEYAKAHHNLGLVMLGRKDRNGAFAHFRKSADLIRNHGHPVNLTKIFPSRIKHDIEQLDYLYECGISVDIPKSYVEILNQLKPQMLAVDAQNQPLRVTSAQAQSLAPSYNRIFYYAVSPALSQGAINPNLDREDIERRYQASHPEILYIDDLLREESLQSLRRFCLESTIWKKDYVEGYLGAMLGEGFVSPLLLQIAEELREQFPGIFCDHRLLQAWAFKQDSQRKPLNIHADAAAVNVNFWITPNEANFDLTCGGLTVWDKEAPKDWDFKDYNDSQYKPKIMEFLRSSGASPITVPYRENRALIFNSDLFHESDHCVFRDDYQSRRINVTFLYGHRS